MLAKIDDFLFEINDTDIQSIEHQLSFVWNTTKRIGNHQYLQQDGMWSESIKFSGRLILKSINALKEFEDKAKEQKPVRITFGTGESYLIVVDSIGRTKSGFFKDGKYRYQEYSISMQRYFE